MESKRVTEVTLQLEMYFKVEVITFNRITDLILNSKDTELIKYFKDATKRKLITLHSQEIQSSSCEKDVLVEKG